MLSSVGEAGFSEDVSEIRPSMIGSRQQARTSVEMPKNEPADARAVKIGKRAMRPL